MTYKYSWEQAVAWLRSQPDQIGLVRACFFDDPIIDAAKRYYESTEWKAVRAILSTHQDEQAGRSVLDIGAGRGISSYAFAVDGWKVTALEPDRSDIVGCGAIEKLISEIGVGLDIRLIRGWGEELPFRDSSFDTVYGRQVLHHATDLDGLCREVSRVLKPGGLFLGTREHVVDKEEDLHRFLDDHPLHHLYGGEKAYVLTRYKNAIRKSGMRLTRILSTYNSDINLFPSSRESHINNMANRLGFFLPPAFRGIVFRLNKSMDRRPGRPYSFLARKI